MTQTPQDPKDHSPPFVWIEDMDTIAKGVAIFCYASAAIVMGGLLWWLA